MTPESPSPSSERIEQTERQRIRRIYDQYDSSAYYRKLWAPDPVSLAILAHKWNRIRALLAAGGIDTGSIRVLDLGAGDGTDCARFQDLGVPEKGIVAFDLRPDALRGGRRERGWMSAVSGDAAELPFRRNSIDLVYQSTMISSILAPEVRRRIIGEIERVVAPGGHLLSYDTRYPNPANRNTRPLRIRELTQALQGWSIRACSLTAVPQLQRLVGGVSHAARALLERVPLLRTHLLVLARKPRSDPGDSWGPR